MLESLGGFFKPSINFGWFLTPSCREGRLRIAFVIADRWTVTFCFKNNDPMPLAGKLEVVTEQNVLELHSFLLVEMFNFCM